jgi:hypothetical protein
VKVVWYSSQSYSKVLRGWELGSVNGDRKELGGGEGRKQWIMTSLTVYMGGTAICLQCLLGTHGNAVKETSHWCLFDS